MELTHIKAIYTPDPIDLEEAKPESVDIVAFTDVDSRAVFIDYDGNLRHGWLRQFSNCVIVTQ